MKGKILNIFFLLFGLALMVYAGIFMKDTKAKEGEKIAQKTQLERNKQTVFGLGKQTSYFLDERTGLCFATWWPSSANDLAPTCVPCNEKVLALAKSGETDTK